MNAVTGSNVQHQPMKDSNVQYLKVVSNIVQQSVAVLAVSHSKSSTEFDPSHSLHIMSIINPHQSRGESSLSGVATCPVDRRAAGAAEAPLWTGAATRPSL